ncbi:uncharacterized protein SAPINGB_P001278 [Magnusiomyces paraingens]|uniref:DUF1776-domain-containing protein n=1 Tax=Magnusiomyces paraingens TaxID=2606893 RepID=A0A5E8B6W8_9ASCO|nr:uncharacterized protein SAPINGB_P001278 [Saprochaete ingens]VVT46568.1 unnamed protein product [Saprochaete ingens]
MTSLPPNDPVAIVLDKISDLKDGTKAAVSRIAENIPAPPVDNDQLRDLGAKVASGIDKTAAWVSSAAGSGVQLITNVASKGKLTFQNTVQQQQQPPPPPLKTSIFSINAAWTALWDWATANKALAGALAGLILTGSVYYLYRLNLGYIAGPRALKFWRRRRLARKAPNGGRSEVVVIAGSPAEPLTRTIAADLARRGYIVYWTTSSPEEEEIVEREESEDIRPLLISPNDVGSVRASIKALASVLNVPATAFPGAIPHMLTLAGVIVVPDLYYPTGPVESICVDAWSDLVNSKILGPIFLLSNGLLDLVRAHEARVLLLSPTIMGSLTPGFHAAESLVSAALDALSLAVSRELASQDIPFVHIKMGSFDVSHGGAAHHAARAKQRERAVQNQVRADILAWPDHLRAIYARTYQAAATALQSDSRIRGEPLRLLNYTIFDALNDHRPSRVYYTGRGAYTYSVLPKFIPENLMSWLLTPKTGNIVLSEKTWEHL